MAYVDKYNNGSWNSPSMDVIKARHRAAVTGKCSCGVLRDPREVSNGLGRRWLSCDRCLGTIKQLS